MTDIEKIFEDLKKHIRTLQEENTSLETEIESLGGRTRAMEAEIVVLTEAADHDAEIELLERFADHGNWTGSTWTPILKYIDEHPADMAGRILREGK
jgi:uncharacterized protein YaaN involved in tellurite resistance